MRGAARGNARPRLLEQITARLRRELPELIDATLREHLERRRSQLATHREQGTTDPQEIEARHYARWEAAGYFAPSGRGEPYCIVIPPPNVTGTLHMGHAFQHTIMDALTRYHRMRGRQHAVAARHRPRRHRDADGRRAAARTREGTSARDLGREEFVERVWQWKEQSGGTISQQMRRLGASVDWSRDRFTMDEGLSRAVIEVFVRLYDEGLIYRGKRLVNWDPVLHTALSDLEVRRARKNAASCGTCAIRSRTAAATLVVATTRPETMLGDTAVAVHPGRRALPASRSASSSRCR